MRKIVLTSCGVINDDFKKKTLKLFDKRPQEIKLLYITTAVDGEPENNKKWVKEEYDTILNLGICEKNICEYKMGDSLDINKFDAIYIIGGNTFYLLDQIRKYHFDKILRKAIDKGIVYIGSSAGSIILGKTIDVSMDKNIVNIDDLTGLNMIDGVIIPHANKKEKWIEDYKNQTCHELYLLYDKDGIIIKE